MKEIVEGRNGSLSILLENNDDVIELDNLSNVVYTISDEEGQVFEGYEDVTLDVNPNFLSNIIIPLPKELNVVAEGDEYSIRNVDVEYEYKNTVQQIHEIYKVIKHPLYTCSKEDVRTVLGVSNTVVSDEMVDLHSAYLMLKHDDISNLDDLLRDKSGNFSTKANRAIVLKSALTFETSLHLLTPKIESDSMVNQTRFTLTGEDFENFFNKMKDDLRSLIGELNEEEPSEYFTIGFDISENTDSFTGE